MNLDALMGKLVLLWPRFPRPGSPQYIAWQAEYDQALAPYYGDALAKGWDVMMRKRTMQVPPKPGEIAEHCREFTPQHQPAAANGGYDGSRTRGGQTALRRPVILSAWLNSHPKLVAEAKDGGWYFFLRRKVEDAANILAQIEWEQQNGSEGYAPPRQHQANLRRDARGWEIFIDPDWIDQWRARNRPVPAEAAE